MTFEFNETSLLLVDNPFFGRGEGEDRNRPSKLSVSLNRIYETNRVLPEFPVNPLSVFTFHRSPRASLEIVSRCNAGNKRDFADTERLDIIELYHHFSFVKSINSQRILSIQSIVVRVSTYKPRWWLRFKKKKKEYLSFFPFLNSREKKEKNKRSLYFRRSIKFHHIILANI